MASLLSDVSIIPSGVMPDEKDDYCFEAWASTVFAAPKVTGYMAGCTDYIRSGDYLMLTNDCIYGEYQNEVTANAGWWEDSIDYGKDTAKEYYDIDTVVENFENLIGERSMGEMEYPSKVDKLFDTTPSKVTIEHRELDFSHVMDDIPDLPTLDTNEYIENSEREVLNAILSSGTLDNGSVDDSLDMPKLEKAPDKYTDIEEFTKDFMKRFRG